MPKSNGCGLGDRRLLIGMAGPLAPRRRADRLSWLAETITTAEPCRDMRAKVDRQ